MQTILPHLLRPLKGGAPSLIIIFAIGLTLAAQAGLMGLPLSLILSSWYWKYAFILFDSTLRGFEDPLALDIQMVNPVDEQRPLAQLCIFIAVYALCHAAYTMWGPTPALIAAFLFVILTPASVAVLGMESHLLRALYPPALIHVIKSLGGLYALVIGVIAGYVALAALIARLDVWLPIQLVLVLFLGLSVFSLLAGVLYDRRDELGLEVWHSPEKKQAQNDAEDRRESQKVVDTAYGELRAASHISAWATLSAWLESRGHKFEDYEWLIERVRPWTDARYVTRITEEYIDRLMAANRNGDALRIVGAAIGHDPQFRPKTAAATLRLAQIAAAGGAPKTAGRLLTNFGERFPGDPAIKAADALAQRLTP